MQQKERYAIKSNFNASVKTQGECNPTTETSRPINKDSDDSQVSRDLDQHWTIFYIFNCKAWRSSPRIVCGHPRRPSPPVQLAAGRRPSQRLPPQHQDHHRWLLQPHQHIIPDGGPRRHLYLLGGKRGGLSKALSSTAGELIFEWKKTSMATLNWRHRWTCHHVGLNVRQTAPGFQAADSRFAVEQAEDRVHRWIWELATFYMWSDRGGLQSCGDRCTLVQLLYHVSLLSGWWDDHYRNPNMNTEIL